MYKVYVVEEWFGACQGNKTVLIVVLIRLLSLVLVSGQTFSLSLVRLCHSHHLPDSWQSDWELGTGDMRRN